MERKKLLIIDSNAVIHRAYHALPPLKTSKGEIVNAVYGFCLIFFKALKDIEPDFVVACFDMAEPTFRHKEFKQYKAKRQKAPDELYNQIKEVKEVLKAFNVPVFERSGFEADDLIATIAKRAIQRQVVPKVENIILTGDMDALQLVNPQTKVYAMRKGLKDVVLFNEEKVKEKYGGLEPYQLTDYRALRGDPSDNIPGVSGIGQKTAIDLLNDFKTLEDIYKKMEKIRPSVSEKLRKYKEQAFISQKLAELNDNVDIDFSLKKAEFSYDEIKVANVLKSFEFNALVDKFLQKSSSQKEMFMKQTIYQKIDDLEKQGVFSDKVAGMEKDLAPVVQKMEKNGIKLSLKCLENISKDLNKEIKRIEKKIYQKSKKNFNINSPRQLSEILFEKLNIPTQGLKKTPGGAVSTGARELKKIKRPIAKLVLDYRELFKLKTGFVDSLPKMINPKTSRIHPHFHQLGTETGRMSCSDPNLQNIPKKGMGIKIRKCFRAEKGFSFLSADYSQMELRVAAFVSEDEKMMKTFREGKDIHEMTAQRVFGDKKKRDLAKTLNFGVLYGMGPVSFAERTGLGKKEAKEFIEKYFQEFQTLRRYTERIKQKAKKQGFSETKMGRKRFLPEINSKDQRLRAQAERMAVNLPLQGYSADIIKLAMTKMTSVLDKNCKMLLQIHDELLFEVKEGKVKEKAEKIKKIMEKAVDIPLEVELKRGKSWGTMKAI